MNVNITPEGRKYITSKTERVEKYFDILIEKWELIILCVFINCSETLQDFLTTLLTADGRNLPV